MKVSEEFWAWPTWTLNTLVVVRVDADFFLFCRERILAAVEGFQLMVTLQVRPTPHSTVDDMRQALPMWHLINQWRYLLIQLAITGTDCQRSSCTFVKFQSINQSIIYLLSECSYMITKKTVSRTARLLNETLTAALMKYTLHKLKTRDAPNSGFRLFGRIWIVLWTIRPNTNTNSWMTQNLVILLINMDNISAK